MAAKVAGLRVFQDDAGRMNRSVLETAGAVLVVSQFTLCGDAAHGLRPSFSDAAPAEIAAPLVTQFAELLRSAGVTPVREGVFGASMQVELVNDGPVTIWLDRPPPARREQAL